MVALIYILLSIGSLIEVDNVWPILPYIATMLFAVFSIIVFRRSRAAVAILLPLVFTRLLILFSLVFIGEGFFIRELGITGNESTHACYFALLSCAFLHLAITTFRLLKGVFVPRPASLYGPIVVTFITGTLGISLAAICYLLANGFNQGFALLEATDRFTYRADQGWLFNVIITQKPVICALLGFIRFRVARSYRTRALTSGMFLALLLTSTLFGDKFLSLLVMMAFFLLPLVALNIPVTRRTRLVGAISGILAGFMVGGLTYYTYSDYGSLDVAQTSERLFGRFTGQGQLWYAVNNQKTQAVAGDPAEAQRLLTVMLATKGADTLAFDTHTGIFQMVERFAPPNIRSSVFESKGFVQFTGAGEAYLMLVFGQLGMMLLLALLAMGCGLATYYVYNSLITGSIFGFAFSIFIVATYFSMLNQGSFWQIFGVRSLVYIGAMLMIDFVSRVAFSRGQRIAAT